MPVSPRDNGFRREAASIAGSGPEMTRGDLIGIAHQDRVKKKYISGAIEHFLGRFASFSDRLEKPRRRELEHKLACGKLATRCCSFRECSL
jgi:hypothetical protein